MSGTVKIVAAVALAGLVASAAPAAGVFSAFGGSYRGTGRISDVNGKSEALTCRSTNAPAQDGIAMNLSLICASDSYRVDFHADLYTDGQTLRGTWSETSRNVNGNVSGSITPSVISATTTAPGFGANIVIQVEKNGRLEIALSATGTSINHVQVSMRK
jgi:hypothetical protein